MIPYVLLDDQKTGITRYFSEPEKVIRAYCENDLDKAFSEIELYHSKGYYLAGYFAYELGFALEPAFRKFLKETEKPLMELGAFKNPPEAAPAHTLYTSDKVDLTLDPTWSLNDYKNRFNEIQNYIQAGDVYQINLTFPMTGHTDWPAHKIYAAFRRAQPGRHGGIISLSDTQIISFSPELFFEKTGDAMRMRPMKGTRPRHHDAIDDAAILQGMRDEPKSQAENLMIVDLLRNDLSRLCKAGSVKVPELFSLETYPTLHQMTSQVEGTLKPHQTWRDILSGLFPCGSVTGAPKIRAMEIIHALETRPRDIYCGSMGFISPNGKACFNVAIRTLQLQNKDIHYNVGSGIVLDSDAEDEYQECILKADVLKSKPQGLFETFRWDPKIGYIRLDAHIARLLKGAETLGIKCSEKAIHSLLNNQPFLCEQTAQRVRLSLSINGNLTVSVTTYQDFDGPLRIALSQYALDSTLQETRYKVEQRGFYDGERERLKASHNIDEVIFLDELNNIAEGSFTSVYIQEKGQLFTPKCDGILPSILRAEYLSKEKAQKSIITLERFLNADKIYIGNALRGLMDVELISNMRL